MAEVADGARDGDAFWQFSLAFYAAPGVSEALIALQDRDGLDVNLMLFALWFGLSGRGRLDPGMLAAADRMAAALRTEVIEPLRSLRRSLKDHADEDVQRLREGVKALELAGEKVAQTRLARLAQDVAANAPPSRRVGDACANFALYLGPERATSEAARIICDALAALPQLVTSRDPVVPAKAGTQG
jgi:uncharacterized protein (TIGR02444 family)